MSTETFTTTSSNTTSNLAPEEHRDAQPRAMKRPNAPAFYNPFYDTSSSSSSSKPTKSFPGLANPFGSSNRSAESADSPGAETPGSSAVRSRTSSFFQSIYSNGSSGASPSDRKGSIFSRKGSRKDSVSQAYMLDSSPKVIRRPSYVPKYAASSHLASMTGRTTAPGMGNEIEGQLRRGSRMISVVPGEMGAPSRLIHSSLPESVEGN